MEEERAQGRLDDFSAEQEDTTRYDSILDQFLEGEHKLVKVTVEGVKENELRTILAERIRGRKLADSIRLTLERGSLYLERAR